MDTTLSYILWITLLLHTVMALIAIWKVWRSRYAIDRLIALDVVSTLIVAILVLIAIIEQDSIFIDVAIGLVALSAITTINLARYLAQEKVF